jgi:cyclopropane-fatty-acyl-phospholipid synthase
MIAVSREVEPRPHVMEHRAPLGRFASPERIIRRELGDAGVAIDRPEAAAGIRVRDPRFYWRVFVDGTLGLGESYVDGWWECDAIDEVTARLLQRGDSRGGWLATLRGLGRLVGARAFNRQTRRRCLRDVPAHYDRDDELFRAMLGTRMVYSCGYWERARTLDEAQEAKLELVCRKLGLRRGHRVLDLGCGWGGLGRYIAERYGASVVGVTIAGRQAQLAREMCAGLPVEIRVQDYRQVAGRFDRVVSIGMLEHVGHKNHATFMQVVRRCLEDDGLALVQVIGNRESAAMLEPWLDRYIFPHAALPSVAQLGRALERRFVLEDWHNFGAHYDRTLLAWHANVERYFAAAPVRYDERFRRLWRYYLLSCAGAFRARYTQLWQLVLSPRGVTGGYRSLR